MVAEIVGNFLNYLINLFLNLKIIDVKFV